MIEQYAQGSYGMTPTKDGGFVKYQDYKQALKTTKPDRFERVVTGLRLDHIASPWAQQIPLECWSSIEHRMVAILRKEHAWMRRMVKKEKQELIELGCKTRQSTDPRDRSIADCLDARVAQCEDILHRLDQRRK